MGFEGAFLFNGDVSNWDVRNVKSMDSMFQKAFSFEGDISKWDVSNVQTMARMFRYAYLFNCDISKWNVGNVRNITRMYEGTMFFNIDLSKWNISSDRSLEEGFFNSTAVNGVDNVESIPTIFVLCSVFLILLALSALRFIVGYVAYNTIY